MTLKAFFREEDKEGIYLILQSTYRFMWKIGAKQEEHNKQCNMPAPRIDTKPHIFASLVTYI